MRWLVGCATSGFLREALRARGIDAWTCDLLPAEDDSPFHWQMDIFDCVRMFRPDRALIHPTCTFMANSGSKHLFIGGRKENGPDLARWAALVDGAEFARRIDDLNIEKFAWENPIIHGMAKALIGRGQDQITQPYFHGDPFFKSTALWLRGFPKLRDTNRLERPLPGTAEHKAWSAVHRAPPGPNRWKDRSRSFPGMMNAMADQWGAL